MEISQKIGLGVFVFSVIMLSILVVYGISQGGLTGVTIGEFGEDGDSDNISQDGEIEIICSDSDNGKYYSIFGSVEYCNKGECSTKNDYCSDDKELIEWYCDDGKIIYEEYECEDGCDEGVCVNFVTDYKVVTSGGGGGSSGGSSGSSSSAATPSVTVTEPTGETYDLGELVLARLDVKESDIIKLNIINMNLTEEYEIIVSDFTETQIKITVGSQTGNIAVNEIVEIDLNSDGIGDISMKLESMSLIKGKVKLYLERI